MSGDKKTASEKKVIPFPNLEERLVQKGLDLLSSRDFKEAANLFSQAREMNAENPESAVGLVVSFVELGYYSEARDLCNELLHKGIGDYFQVVNIYLMVLLQLNEHREMITTIEALLDDDQVPFDKIDHFEKMLGFSKRVLEEKQEQADLKQERFEEEMKETELFKDKTESEILLGISKLADMNARPFITQIKDYLASDEGHPFLKTLLLNILQDQEYDRGIEIEKFSKKRKIVPAELPPLKTGEFFTEVSGMIEDVLGQENPTQAEMILSLFERHHFLIYPFEPKKQDYPAWAAAYHVLGDEYQSGECTAEEAAGKYGADAESVMKTVQDLKEYEEISYPII
ncbi:tetratricopeptide repeat protein [Actinomycetes bacterium NPDC127524]